MATIEVQQLVTGNEVVTTVEVSGRISYATQLALNRVTGDAIANLIEPGKINTNIDAAAFQSN